MRRTRPNPTAPNRARWTKNVRAITATIFFPSIAEGQQSTVTVLF
jgi:hypothetical protein